MKNFVSIESLRAYMAWWVVLGHASHLARGSDFLPRPFVQILERGDIAVNVFVIVSGFVITHLISSKNESYAPYITRRFFRIFPVYIACLAIAMLLTKFYQAAYSNPWVVASDMRAERILAEQQNFWTYAGLHLSLLHGMVPDSLLPFASSTFLAPAWSLSLEWQFYLIAPGLIALLARKSVTMMVTAMGLIATFAIFKSGTMGYWAYPSFLPLSIHYFLIGILSRVALGALQDGTLKVEFLVLPAILIAAISGPLESVIWITFLGFTLIELGTLKLESPMLRRAMELLIVNPRIATLGAWSYSSYLLHIPIFSIVIGSATLLWPGMNQVRVILLLAGCMPLVLLASWASFSAIEKPFNLIGRRIANRMSAPSHKAAKPRS